MIAAGFYFVDSQNELPQLIMSASAQEHDHAEDEAGGHEHAEDSISHTAWTDHIEWFIELARPIPNHAAQFAAHVTLLKDFSAAMEGKFDVVATQGSQRVETHSDAPARPGIYTPSIMIPSTGIWTINITFTNAILKESIQYEIDVYAEVQAPVEDDDGGGISLLKEQQWNLPFQTAWTETSELAEYLPVYGTIVPRPAGHAKIIAPIAGRFFPGDGGQSIQPGTVVQENEVIGYIEPQYAGPEMTAQLLNQSELISSRSQVERDIAQNKQRMESAKKELERVKALFEQKAKSQKDVEQAELDYELSKGSYESAQRLLSQLNNTKDAVSRGRLPILSPIKGTINHMEAVAGSYIETNGELFEIIDLSNLWVDAHLHEQDISLLNENVGAYISTAAYKEQIFECDQLVHIGSSLEMDTRTLPVKYLIANPNQKLKIGMAVTVYLEIKPLAQVLSIPESAVTDEDARNVVYVQVDGESFERRVVQLGRKDRGMVEVTKGLEQGERVVSQGSHFVRLASLQTQMSGGHGHPH
jgi:RND family efflux transporter MFP subunit